VGAHALATAESDILKLTPASFLRTFILFLSSIGSFALHAMMVQLLPRGKKQEVKPVSSLIGEAKEDKRTGQEKRVRAG
jgi:hypothetical protein